MLMADDDDGFMIRISFVEAIEIVPQQSGRIRKWITAWVSKEPELVVVANLRVCQQLVEHRHQVADVSCRPWTKRMGIFFGSCGCSR